jgi:hypothetical protein
MQNPKIIETMFACSEHSRAIVRNSMNGTSDVLVTALGKQNGGAPVVVAYLQLCTVNFRCVH